MEESRKKTLLSGSFFVLDSVKCGKIEIYEGILKKPLTFGEKKNMIKLSCCTFFADTRRNKVTRFSSGKKLVDWCAAFDTE